MKDRDPTKEPIVRKARNGSAWAWTTDIHALFAQYGPRRHWHFMEACRKAMKDVGKEHFIEGQYTRKSGQVDDCFGIDEVGYEAMCRRMHLNALDEPRGIYQKAYRKVYDAWLKRKLSKPTREEPPDLDPAIIPDEPELVAAPEPEPPPGPPELNAATIPDDPRALEPGAAVQPFMFDDQDGGYTVRVTDRAGNPWWIAADLCLAVGLSNVSQAVARLEEDEKGIIQIDTLGGVQEVLAVNEPGMYSLILRSDKPRARRFKRWVTHEVLPQIRRTGRYESAPVHPALPTDYLSALQALLESEQSKAVQATMIAAQAQQVAALSSEKAELVAKVEEQDQFLHALRRLSATGGLTLVSDVAKVLHIPQGDLFELLYRAGYIFKRKKHDSKSPWLAYDKWVKKGLFDHRYWTHKLPDGTEKDRPQLYVTPKGAETIWLLFAEYERNPDPNGQRKLALGMH